MQTSCIGGRDSGKLSKSPEGTSHHLSYHLQLKTKEDVGVGVEEASYGRLAGKAW